MESHIVFQSPVGARIANPSLPDILALMEGRDQAYWNSDAGNGFGTLSYFDDDEETARLVMTKGDGYGFHVNVQEYPYRTGHSADYFAVGGDDYKDVPRLHMSGNRIFIPRALFIPTDKAICVVNQFFTTGSRSSEVPWIALADLNWDIETGRTIL
jgi:hypothetical protein